MADNEKTTRIVFDGSATGLVAAAQQAQGSLAKVEMAMGKITSVAGIVAGVLAGGAMFKAAVDETEKWNSEAIKLARTLGITTEQASILNLAMGDIYLSSEDLIRASSMMTRQLRTNEDAFQNMGIKTRDSNNHYRSSVDIMTDVNAKLATLKEGTDRNAAGMAIYGRSWQEISNIVKLNKEVMAEAERKARELHLIVGPEGVAQTMAYKAAMNDAEDVFSALKIQIGNQLLPILTRLAVWFSDIGPTTLFVLGGALKIIITFVASLAEGFNILGTIALTALRQIWEGAITAGTVIQNALSGNFSGAIAAAKQGWGEIEKIGAQGFDNIKKSAIQTGQLLVDVWMPKQGKASIRPAGGVNNYVEPPKGDKYDADKVDSEMRLDYYTHEIERIKLLEGARIEEQNQNTDFALKRIETERSTQQSIAQITAETTIAKQRALNDEMGAEETAYQYKLSKMDQEYIDRVSYANQIGMDTNLIMQQYELERTQMEEAQAKKRGEISLNETKQKIGWATSGFQSMASIAESFYTLSGKKSKAAFEVAKVMKIGETVGNTAAAAMAAYKAMAGIPYVGPALGIAAAAAAVLAGAAHIKSIQSTSPDGGGTLPGDVGYGGGTPSSPIVTQPVNQPQDQGSLTIVINNPIGEKRWFEENLPGILKDFKSRNVDVGFATT